MDINEVSNETENKTQFSNHKQTSLEIPSSSMDTSNSCGVVKVKEEPCDLVISNVQQEADIFYKENRDSSTRSSEMNVDTCHLLISQVKSEVDTLHNESSSSSVNSRDAGNIQDLVISHIKQEADIFYDENIGSDAVKSPKCENIEGKSEGMIYI